MRQKNLYIIIVLETLVIIILAAFICLHLKCYHKPAERIADRILYDGPRGGKYYIDKMGRRIYVTKKLKNEEEKEAAARIRLEQQGFK